MFSHCTVWYPALNPQGLKEQTVFSFDYFPNLPAMPIVSTALRDAAPDIENGPYPLVIYAHGSNDQRATNPYYVEHITSYGFVVMSINYEDNMGTWGQPLYPSLISRPADVTRQIDFAKTLTVEGGALAGMIDMDKIGVTGWSLGGFTALMAGNAQLDLEWMRREACSNPVFDPLEKCDETLDNVDHLVQLAGLEEAPEGTWPGMGDPRVDAIVPLAPAGRFIGEEGADNVKVPTLMMVGTLDFTTIAEVNYYPVFEGLGSEQKALVKFENGGHLLFGSCWRFDWAVQLFGAMCFDPIWDMNRAGDIVDHLTTAFLLWQLKGDEEAKSALMPEAVAFPGITYEATFE